MKLVGASWRFIRWPFMKQALTVGLIAAVLACGVLAGCAYGLYTFEPGIVAILTWRELVIVAASVFLFGILITWMCSYFSVNKFLRMTAGEIYKI